GAAVSASSHGAAAQNTIAWPANSQNTPRQFPASANSPPSSGPNRVATPQTAAVQANTLARWRGGNSTAIATIDSPATQPAPTPWTRRPARNHAMSGASAPNRQPTAK